MADYKGMRPFRELGAVDESKARRTASVVIKAGTAEARAANIVVETIRRNLTFGDVVREFGKEDRVVFELAMNIIRIDYPSIFRRNDVGARGNG